MIGQYADSDGFKRPARLNSSVGFPETLDFIDQKAARPFVENDREEEDPAFELGTYVLRHGASISL